MSSLPTSRNSIRRFRTGTSDLADQPRQALFEHHGVRDAEDPWLYKQLLTNRAARTVQQYFIEHLKTAGAPPMEQSENVDCVYLYKVAAHTRQ